MIIVLPALARPILEPHLSKDAEVRWFASAEDAYAMAPGAERKLLAADRPFARDFVLQVDDRLD